jgi:hypothetical protein
MSESDFNKIMRYLDIIITELDIIATSVGHTTFDEFFKEDK